MTIGILSDTHNVLDRRLADIFAGVDHILHAGDVCQPSLICALNEIAPVTVVRGNNDSHPGWREMEVRDFDGHRFLIQHIVNPLHPAKPLLEVIQRLRPHVVVFGHTHSAYIESRAGVLYLNPGSAGPPRFGLGRSVCRLNLNAHPLSPEFIDLK